MGAAGMRIAMPAFKLNLTDAYIELNKWIKKRWAINTTRGWKDIAAASALVTAQLPPFGSSLPSSSSLANSNALAAVAVGDTLHFRPELDDFATVACWAFNQVGHQQEPCLFRFFAAGRLLFLLLLYYLTPLLLLLWPLPLCPLSCYMPQRMQRQRLRLLYPFNYYLSIIVAGLFSQQQPFEWD